MRTHRIRFSTQTLLLTTAVLAADCALLRYLYTSDTLNRTVSLFSRASPGLLAGFLPLLHFALLGLACFMTKRLLPADRRSAARSHQRPPAGTYFCVHFLVLGCVVARFAPTVIADYSYGVATFVVPVLSRAEPFLAPIVDRITDPFAHFLNRIDDPFTTFLLQGFVEALLISGPLLLLAVVGHAIANRAAKSLPRSRFARLTGLVSFGFALTGLSVCLTPRPIDEDPAIDLNFHVVDRETDRPIGAAVVRVIDAFAHGPPSGPTGLTNRAGDVRLTRGFPAMGQRNAFVTMGSCSLWGHWLEVSAANYRTIRVPLTAGIGSVVDLGSAHVAKIALLRGETPAAAFRDCAGCYTTSLGFGGCTFKMTSDGRFCWEARSCTGPSAQEYGYVRAHHGEMEFIPIPRLGHEVSPCITVRHRLIKWDGRRFLCLSRPESLHQFCRAGLSLNDSRTFARVSGAYREGNAIDQPRPLRGFPKLAGTVWLSFLRSETDLHNEKGSLRRAVDALNPWRPRARREPALAL